MGYIPSASTVYAVAYLTDTGRSYLFNNNNSRFDSNGNDLFQVVKFTLSDSDTNYKTEVTLDSGEVPDITGRGEGCLKATANYVQSDLIAFVFDNTPTDVEYSTNLDGDPPTLTINIDDLPDTTENPPQPDPGTLVGNFNELNSLIQDGGTLGISPTFNR